MHTAIDVHQSRFHYQGLVLATQEHRPVAGEAQKAFHYAVLDFEFEAHVPS
jgi:hypothetical protein